MRWRLQEGIKDEEKLGNYVERKRRQCDILSCRSQVLQLTPELLASFKILIYRINITYLKKNPLKQLQKVLPFPLIKK